MPMTEPTPTDAPAAAPVDSERRGADRRRDGDSGRRGMRRRSPRMEMLNAVVSYTFGILALVGVILFALAHTRPIFTQRASLTARIAQRGDSIQRARGAAPVPTDVADADLKFRDPKVEADRKAFASDLVATGRMEQARADSVSYFATREAYSRGIPPALIFAVMLTENAVFKSRATSNVGAVGLMQIYPKVWLKALSKKFGHDLENDETNLKYGTFILAEYLKPKKGSDVATEADLRKGLLKYNGCVRGTNTPRCHTYPNKVDKFLQNDAKTMCKGRGFYDCVARPFVAGITGDTASLASAD
jgi:hypothetical protein